MENLRSFHGQWFIFRTFSSCTELLKQTKNNLSLKYPQYAGFDCVESYTTRHKSEPNQFAEVTWSEAGFRHCWTRKVASPLSLYWLRADGKLCVEVATAIEAGQVERYTPLGCWIMARYCCTGRECDCKSTSQDAHEPKSRGREEHWKNEQVTKLLELKWLRWRWTGNTRVGCFYSLMGWWSIRTFRKGCNR